MKKKILSIVFLVFYMLVYCQQGQLQPYIAVDQFGYRPGDDKVAVIVDPQTGFNADDSFVPGNTYEVRRVSNNNVVYTGSPKLWNDGFEGPTNGDKGWWFDFSLVTQQGDFYIYDVDKKKRSHVFHISENVYEDALKAAARMFYYQRLGTNKPGSFAEAPWVDNAVWVPQDKRARDINDPFNPATERDVSGGWMDAGDANKYVSFASISVNQLLSSYTENKAMWDNLDLEIPESSNSIPDILDEVKWELDWVIKMQDDDGGVFAKAGTAGFDGEIPSENNANRYYEQKCSSATLAAAGMFAHGYLVYKNIPGLNGYAQDLKNRAILAWNYFADINAEILDTNCDPGYNDSLALGNPNQGICCGDADKADEREPEKSKLWQRGEAAAAAAYLFAATGNSRFNQAFEKYYNQGRHWISPGEREWGLYEPNQSDALQFYTTLPNASPAIKTAILQKMQIASGLNNYSITARGHLYRAYLDPGQIIWGVNSVRNNSAIAALDFKKFGSNPPKNALFSKHAKNVLHYLHGVNPLQMTYLSSMDRSSKVRYPAEFSASAVYHDWFRFEPNFSNGYVAGNDGPAPGYLLGGANYLAMDLVANTTYDGGMRNGDPSVYKVQLAGTNYNSRLIDQPSEKQFTEDLRPYDFENRQVTFFFSYTEPSLAYQSTYVKLLANFVGKDSGTPVADAEELGTNVNSVFAVLPEEVEAGKIVPITISYSASENANVFFNILKFDPDNPSADAIPILSPESGIGIPVSPGTGTVTVKPKIPLDTDPGTNYFIFLNLFNEDYSATLESFPTASLSITANNTGEDKEDSLTIENAPDQISIGQTLVNTISYFANQDGYIYYQLFDTRSGSFVAAGNSPGVVPINAGNGQLTMNLPVLPTALPGTEYVLIAEIQDGNFQPVANTSVSDITLVSGGVPASGTIEIFARGDCGSEQMELLLDGEVVKTWQNVSTSLTRYTYSEFTGTQNIEVAFTNDGPAAGCSGRNLFVDKITVCGTVYESEDTATVNSICGNPDYLFCNGSLDFGALTCEGDNGDTTYYFIKNKHLGDYLRPANATTNAAILVEPKDDSDFFKWEKVMTTENFFYLKNKATGKYFRPEKNENNSRLQQKPTNFSGNATQWKLVLSSDNTYSYLLNRAHKRYIRAIDNTDRRVQAKNTSSTGSWTRWIFEEVPDGVRLLSQLSAETAPEKITLYPNPVKKALTVEAPNGIDFMQYRMYDVTGKIIKEGELKNSRRQINVEELPSGLYFLNILGTTLKFMKD